MTFFRQGLTGVLALLLGACTLQPELSSREIDDLVHDAMEAFAVPGIAVGVIKDGTVIHAKGYGVREIGVDGAVDSDTLFRIASTTKAMTAASLAPWRVCLPQVLRDAGLEVPDGKVVVILGPSGIGKRTQSPSQPSM